MTVSTYNGSCVFYFAWRFYFAASSRRKRRLWTHLTYTGVDFLRNASVLFALIQTYARTHFYTLTHTYTYIHTHTGTHTYTYTRTRT